MNHLTKLIVGIVAGVCSAGAFGYPALTHQFLSQIATDRSELNGSIGSVLRDIDAAPFSSTVYVRSDGLPNQSIRQLVGFGAVEEDNAPKWFSHFFDPQYNNFQGSPLHIWPETFGVPLLIGQNTSPDWAIEDAGHRNTSWFQGLGSQSQEFSYREAKEYFKLSMTGSTPAFRSANMTLMFESLGHVIHHIQDMAQPQHTRNDPHIPTDYGAAFAAEYFGVQPPNAPAFEAYTLSEFPTEQKVLNFLASPGASPFAMNPPTLPTIRHYWHTPGAISPTFVGMAEFTSQNFVSTGSLFVPPNWPFLSGDPSSPSQLYVPLPDGTNTSIVPRVVQVRYADGSTINSTVDFIVGTVRDGLFVLPYAGRELAVTSLLTQLSQIVTSRRVVSINREVFRATHEILLPRAVAFSSGIINHFFRGRLGVRRTPDENNLWEVSNFSAETMSGAFSIYFESSTGQRNRYGAAVATLVPGASVNVVAPEPASSTAKVIAVFEGSLGAEANFAGGIAAAKAIPYTTPPPPPIPCGSPLTAEGSSKGLVEIYELGTTAGTVPVEFEAYNIPDGLNINANNSVGTPLVDTGGLVSGRYNYSFQHDPIVLGTTQVTVTVTGNTNTNTLWWIVVGCPGGGATVDPGDRPQPIRSVRWTFAKDGASGVSCNFDFHIDGQFVRKVFGNASFLTQMSVGRHDLEYRNKSCSAGSSAAYTATYQDPTGVYPVKSPIFGNTWIYEIH